MQHKLLRDQLCTAQEEERPEGLAWNSSIACTSVMKVGCEYET